ncbi:hypothetical protein IMZ48_34660 [Candidatus Bathyarchaeota archaeon]|nr:hypothetical protein [Candidatus Bathyarchaeota archaeon]
MNATRRQQINSPPGDDAATTTPLPTAPESSPKVRSRNLEGVKAISKTQVRANWDPSYPGEPSTSWYDEYIQRHSTSLRTNWFQSPYRSGATKGLLNEARGLALYTPGKVQGEPREESLFAVSPLEDGTVCLWDVNGTRVRKGAVLDKSAPGALFSYGNDPANARWENRSNSVTECVSVDSLSNRAFFAVQSRKCFDQHMLVLAGPLLTREQD